MRRIVALLTILAVLFAGCGEENVFDAHGNFEAEEVTVSAQAGGQLLRFQVDEGDRLAAGLPSLSRTGEPLHRREDGTKRRVVGLIDTTHLHLQRRELRARRQSVRAQRRAVLAEVDVLAEKLRSAQREMERMRTLHAGDAAPEREMDRAEDEVGVLERRIEATRAKTARFFDEIEAINEKIAQVNERVEKSWVTNPIAGTVLTTYAEKGEVVRSGEPLYKIASLDTLTLRAYVSGAQLSSIKIGQRARVFIDEGPDERRAVPGRVTWVADDAEFTPTPIQTKEERVDFVYAVKLRVPNPDGAIKIGMPADVSFGGGPTSETAPAGS